MFGIKIINQKEYDELLRIKKESYERIQNVIDGRKKLESDCKSLREQLKALAKEKEQCCFGTLSELYVLKSEDYPCDKCNLESDKCKKLIFSNQTICVTNKYNVNIITPKKCTKRNTKNK